jgi:hypothetical protein
VSICNPFFVDVGLLSKEGQKQKPSDDVVNYAAAYEWDAEKSTSKLAPALRGKWFATVLLPKLSFRSMTREEAVGFLADDAKAPKDYKTQLELLLEYLRVAGVINIDGTTVTLGQNARESSDETKGSPIVTDPPAGAAAAGKQNEQKIDETKLERFSVPIPGKESATITFPKDLDKEDWLMLKSFMEAYVKRLKKWSEEPNR